MRPDRTGNEYESRFKELALRLREVRRRSEVRATKLNKTLYFADFLAYAELGQPITGMDYQKLPNWTAARRGTDPRGNDKSQGAYRAGRQTREGAPSGASG